MNPPCQELVAKDLHGSEWKFRHIYRGNMQPKHVRTDDILSVICCMGGLSIWIWYVYEVNGVGRSFHILHFQVPDAVGS